MTFVSLHADIAVPISDMRDLPTKMTDVLLMSLRTISTPRNNAHDIKLVWGRIRRNVPPTWSDIILRIVTLMPSRDKSEHRSARYVSCTWIVSDQSECVLQVCNESLHIVSFLSRLVTGVQERCRTSLLTVLSCYHITCSTDSQITSWSNNLSLSGTSTPELCIRALIILNHCTLFCIWKTTYSRANCSHDDQRWLC